MHGSSGETVFFQLFCVWRSRGRRKGDPNINVVGKNVPPTPRILEKTRFSLGFLRFFRYSRFRSQSPPRPSFSAPVSLFRMDFHSLTTPFGASRLPFRLSWRSFGAPGTLQSCSGDAPRALADSRALRRTHFRQERDPRDPAVALLDVEIALWSSVRFG